MLARRILTAIPLIVVIIAAIFLEWFFYLMMVIFTALGLYEFFTMLEFKGIKVYKYFGIAMGILIPLSIMLKFEPTKKWELAFIILTLLFLIVMQFKRRQNSGVIVDISTTIFGIIYVSWFFSFLIKIRSLEGGIGYFTSLLIITKLGDVGSYLIGSRFGRIPLIPRISPNKSIEGAIGGLLFSLLGAFASRPLLNFSYTHLIALGIFLGFLGQLGDLSESLIKRDCKVKDSGNLLPGMGGVLDVIDSLLFTAPAFYFYLGIISL